MYATDLTAKTLIRDNSCPHRGLTLHVLVCSNITMHTNVNLLRSAHHNLNIAIVKSCTIR